VNRPRLVLLPGLDGTGDLFRPFLNAVGSAAPSTVVRYSSPEVSGYAECRAVAEAQLPDSEPYILVGESFSGPIAVSIAATNPPGLRGLVLVGSFVETPRLALRWLSAFIDILPTHNGPSWLTDFLLLSRWATPELRQRIADAMAKVSQIAVRARLREIAHVNASAELSKIQAPILYLRATHDRLVPRSCADRIVSLAPRAMLLEIDAPHMLLQCAPAECAKAIRDFTREADEVWTATAG
jgi:pimeloyl-ACP methyl ester carboxylesterase